jgi:hypothetical protein
VTFRFALAFSVSNGPRNVVHSFHTDKEAAVAVRKELVKSGFRFGASSTCQGKILGFEIRPVHTMEVGF